MIDVTKPLELTDGTPVTFKSFDQDGDIIVMIEGLGVGRVFSPEGVHWLEELPNLRNVSEPEVPAFDPTKPVATRDGRKARIICTDRKDHAYPIVGLIMDADGNESENVFTTCGHYFSHKDNDPRDLVNIPDRKVTYRTFDWDGDELRLGGCVEDTEQSARSLLGGHWDGVVKITTENGKFLSAEMVPAAA